MLPRRNLPAPRFALMGGTPWVYAGVAILLLGLFVGVGLFFVSAIEGEEREYLAQNDTIARSIAASIEMREEGYVTALRADAARLRFRESVKRRDARDALVHLRQLHETFPELDRVFLADPAGIVWVTEPETPEIYGRNYAFQDWYRGVSTAWQPYMSEIYEADIGHAAAVALAVPIHDVDGRVTGILTSVQRLEVLREWLLPIQIPGGDIFVVDRTGHLVFHRTRVGPKHLADYVHVPVVRRLLEGGDGVAQLPNPIDREVNLYAYHRLPSLGWGVVVYRTKHALLQRTRRLILASVSLGLVLAATLVGIGSVALRYERRTAKKMPVLDRVTLLADADLNPGR